MSNPYRWGDVAPPAVQKIKAEPLQISVDLSPLAKEMREISLSLKGLSEGSHHFFLNELGRLFSSLGEGCLLATPLAGKNVLRLELSTAWISELRAAAARARQSDLV